MNEKLFSLLSGIIFGMGLVISGMTNPEKVIGFLSIANNWDASLMFVMGGAIIITAPFFYFLKDRNKSSALSHSPCATWPITSKRSSELQTSTKSESSFLISKICFGVSNKKL